MEIYCPYQKSWFLFLAVLQIIMPNFNGRCTNQGSWSKEYVKSVVEQVLSGKMSIRRAVDYFQLRKSSLQDKVTGKKVEKNVIFNQNLDVLRLHLIIIMKAGMPSTSKILMTDWWN